MDTNTDALGYWRLADSLTVTDAALLAIGQDPSEVNSNPHDYKNFTAVFKALKTAILGNKLQAQLVFETIRPDPYFDSPPSTFNVSLSSETHAALLKGQPYDRFPNPVLLITEPDWDRSHVDVDDLKAWFRSRRFSPPFFFPGGSLDSFMNKEHSRYAPKLACAVAAWKTVEHPARNKSVKQTIEEWVTANGVSFGLGNEDGVVPTAAIEEIAKVANWQPQGGAARTGGQVEGTSPPTPPIQPSNYEPMVFRTSDPDQESKANASY